MNHDQAQAAGLCSPLSLAHHAGQLGVDEPTALGVFLKSRAGISPTLPVEMTRHFIGWVDQAQGLPAHACTLLPLYCTAPAYRATSMERDSAGTHTLDLFDNTSSPALQFATTSQHQAKHDQNWRGE